MSYFTPNVFSLCKSGTAQGANTLSPYAVHAKPLLLGLNRNTGQSVPLEKKQRKIKLLRIRGVLNERISARGLSKRILVHATATRPTKVTHWEAEKIYLHLGCRHFVTNNRDPSESQRVTSKDG